MTQWYSTWFAASIEAIVILSSIVGLVGWVICGIWVLAFFVWVYQKIRDSCCPPKDEDGNVLGEEENNPINPVLGYVSARLNSINKIWSARNLDTPRPKPKKRLDIDEEDTQNLTGENQADPTSTLGPKNQTSIMNQP